MKCNVTNTFATCILHSQYVASVKNTNWYVHCIKVLLADVLDIIRGEGFLLISQSSEGGGS